MTLLVEDGGGGGPFSPVETTYAAMGRFGNVLLVAVASRSLVRRRHQAGEVVRLSLTNTANTRVFNVALPGARMKLIGGDSGRVEHEEFVSEVILGPVRAGGHRRCSCDRPGQLELRAPAPRTDLPARRDHGNRRPGHAVAG